MTTRHFLLTSCAAILLISPGAAHAGPCNTANKDAGSGLTPGASAQTATTGIAPARSEQHPPTGAMSKAAGETATSSEDAQRQMQGQPTASQEAQGTKGKAGTDC
jgi:hypothetical protein